MVIDEAGPLRLNRSMVKAKAAIGEDNPSQARETLARINQGILVLDDVSHLAPVSYVPRYSVRFSVASGANFATAEIAPSPRPYLIESVDPTTNNLEIATSATSLVSSAFSPMRIFDPLETVAPRTLVFTQGQTTTDVNGALMEANRIFLINQLVPPNIRVVIQPQSSGNALDCMVVIQEFPGGD